MSRKQKIKAVLDTDTYNEIDDQFALAYLMLAKELFEVRGVFAAPFSNSRSSGPADGMEKSYEEILRLFELLGENPEKLVFRGSRAYLPDRNTPVDSPAARRLIELAGEARADGEKLAVLAIAAITNVASALLIAPEIANDISIIWLGGHEYDFENNREFNLFQDVPAGQVIFDSGAELIHVPCCNVASALLTDVPELFARCRPSGRLGKYLAEITRDYMAEDKVEKKVIWDIATVGFLSCPEAFKNEVISAPILRDDSSWELTAGRHPVTVVRAIDRDIVFDDLFARLAEFAAGRNN